MKMNFVLFGKCRPTARVSVQRLHARFKVSNTRRLRLKLNWQTRKRNLMRLTGCLKLFVKIRLTSSSKPGNWKTRPISLNFHGLIT